MLNIDLWYDNKMEEIDDITIIFSDLDCEYRGNFLIAGKYVGDFVTDDSSRLRDIVPQVFEIPFC